METLLINENVIKFRSILGLSNLDDVYFFSILLVSFLLIFLIVFYLILGSKSHKKSILVGNTAKPTLNEIINKTDSLNISGNDNDFVDVLVAIEEEMAAVRELYVGGYITKGIYISETDRLYEKAKVFGL